MIEVNKNMPDVPINRTQKAESEKKEITTQEEQVSSYDDKIANSAMATIGKSLVKQRFKPAQTKEELKEQIINTKWLDPQFNKPSDINDLEDEADVKEFSEIWHKLDELSPLLQGKINPNYVINDYRISKQWKNQSWFKNFSVDKINQLDTNLLKSLDSDFCMNLFSVQVDEPKTVNKLFYSVKEDYRPAIFSNFRNCAKSSQETSEMIKKTEYLNRLTPDVVENIGAINILESPIHINYLDKQTNFLNSLPKETREKLTPTYLQKIFKESYSYALDNNNNTPVCGTDKFKPFTKKEQLKTELASMRGTNGEWEYSNNDINKVLNNENDIYELSKILHGVKSNGIEISSYDIKNLLLKEGITFRDIKSGLDFAKYIKETPQFDEVREKLLKTPNIFNLSQEDLENIKNNTSLIELIKEYNPEEFKKELEWGGGTLLKILKNSKIKPEILKDILTQNIYTKNLNIYDIETLVKNDKLNNIQPQNIKFINDLKNNKSTSFIFNSIGASNNNVTEMLKMNLPENFELENQKDMIKLTDYITSDKKRANVIGDFNQMAYVKLLTRNDNLEDGKELVDFIAENDLCDCDSNKYLTTNTFKENLELLKQIKDIEMLNERNAYGDLYKGNYSIVTEFPPEETQNALDMVKYASKQDKLKDIRIGLRGILREYCQRKEYGLESCNKEEIKQNIANLVSVSETISPKIWNKIKENALVAALKNDKTEQLRCKKENVDYFNKFIEDERTEELFKPYITSKLLEKNLDINALNANYEDKFEFVEKYKDEISSNQFITYTGDIKKLECVYEELRKENPGEKVSLKVDENTNEVIFETDSRSYQYDKDMNLMSKASIRGKQKKDGEIQAIANFEDMRRKISNEVTYKLDAVYDYRVPTHVVSKYYDNDGIVSKARIYDESGLDGVYNIKELYPDGKIKTLSSGYENSDGQFIEKNLESLDGTKSKIRYKKDKAGNENYEYLIIDKDGNQLLDLKRATEIVDEHTKITTVNDRKYEIKYSDESILVNDINNNTTTTLNLKELNPKNDSVLKDLLQSLSGDELLKVKKYVKELELIPRIESGMEGLSRKMYIGPHKFIFEHELGHAKDEILTEIKDLGNIESMDDIERKICSDKKLQEIFEKEKRALKEKLPNEITEEANYFINDTTHYAGKLGGLAETIAEINAIQTTARFHPLLMMRTEVLQEYFPRTIAYLVNNKL